MNKKFLKHYEGYMSIIGPVSNFMFIIQAYEIFCSQNALDISLPGFCLSLIGFLSWLIYGLILKIKPLIIGNTIAVVGTSLILIGKLKYG